MPKDITPIQFTQKLTDCINEYRKQMGDTRDETDAAFFYNKTLKKFIKDHDEAITTLSKLNFERQFITFIRHYLFKDKKK